MAIKRLIVDVGSFPKLGDLFKGDPKTSIKKGGRQVETVGADTDHWRFESEDEQAMKLFEAAYRDAAGEVAPRLVHIFLPYNTAAENFEFWQEEHTAGQLVHRCDGEDMVQWRDPDGRMKLASEYGAKPCPYKDWPEEKKKCKPVGTLRVIISELGILGGKLGLTWVHTGSIWDIIEIQRNLLALEDVNRGPDGQPHLKGVPLDLKRVEREVSSPMPDGKRRRVKKWLIHIEAHPSWVQLKLAAMQQAEIPQLEEGRGPLLLEAYHSDALEYAAQSLSEDAEAERAVKVVRSEDSRATPATKEDRSDSQESNGGRLAQQLSAIAKIAKAKKIDAEVVSASLFKKPVKELNSDEAGKLIQQLQVMNSGETEPAKGPEKNEPASGQTLLFPELTEKQKELQQHINLCLDKEAFRTPAEALKECSRELTKHTGNEWKLRDLSEVPDEHADYLLSNVVTF